MKPHHRSEEEEEQEEKDHDEEEEQEEEQQPMRKLGGFEFFEKVLRSPKFILAPMVSVMLFSRRVIPLAQLSWPSFIGSIRVLTRDDSRSHCPLLIRSSVRCRSIKVSWPFACSVVATARSSALLRC